MILKGLVKTMYSYKKIYHYTFKVIGLTLNLDIPMFEEELFPALLNIKILKEERKVY